MSLAHVRSIVDIREKSAYNMLGLLEVSRNVIGYYKKVCQYLFSENKLHQPPSLDHLFEHMPRDQWSCLVEKRLGSIQSKY